MDEADMIGANPTMNIWSNPKFDSRPSQTWGVMLRADRDDERNFSEMA